MIKAMHLHVNRGEDRLNLITKEEWETLVKDFNSTSRGRAANLAAHNWDVILVGERLLVCCAWSGGDWYSKDGTIESVSNELHDNLYPKAEQSYLANKTTYSYDKIYRQIKINLDALDGMDS